MARPIIFLLLLAVPLGADKAQPAGSESGQHTKATESKAGESGESHNSQATVTYQQAVCSMLGACESQGQTPKNADPSRDWVDWVNAFSTSVIAAFTVLLFFAVIGQTRTSKNAERAWVIVSPVEAAPVVGFIPERGDPLNEPGPNQQNAFICSFKNTGETPARLVDAAVIYRMVQRLGDVPAEPDYGQKCSLNDLPLVKEDSISWIAFLLPEIILTKLQASAVRSRQAFLYAYGVVDYRDVFGRPHETRFGYTYSFPHGGDTRPPGFRREELPQAYNRAT
jgi:hypothetical protein